MSIHHVQNTDGKGWLTVLWSDGSRAALPQCLRLETTRSESGRQYFTILEGVHAGKEASVKLRDDGSSYLGDGDPWLSSARVRFSLSTRQLWYADEPPISAKTYEGDPLPPGTHDVEIPDFPHKKGKPYQDRSVYATTWFRLGHTGERYLHPGDVSRGCATVTEIRQWTGLYEYLICRRKGDGKSVGTIHVEP